MKSFATTAILWAGLGVTDSGLGAQAASDPIFTEGQSTGLDAGYQQGSENMADASNSAAKTSAFTLRKEAASRIPAPDRVMNDKVRNFQLDPKDHVMMMPTGNYENNVFVNVPLYEREEKTRSEFKKWSEDKSLPPGFIDESRQALRILACSDQDFQETYDKIMYHDQDIRERVVPLLNDWTKYEELLNNGFYYGYGRDRNMKPIIWMNVRKQLDAGVSIEDMLSVMDILINFTIENAFNPGHIETYHTICDFDGVGLTQLPIGSFAHIAISLRKNYFVRCQSLTFINVPFLVHMASKFIFGLMDEFQQEKTRILAKDYKDFLASLLGEENLQVRYGGQLADNKDDFFPPKFNIEVAELGHESDKQQDQQQTEL